MEQLEETLFSGVFNMNGWDNAAVEVIRSCGFTLKHWARKSFAVSGTAFQYSAGSNKKSPVEIRCRVSLSVSQSKGIYPQSMK